MERSYVSIDLKSFFASVECVERGLNPLTTNLVVADSSRTEKTICLAVTPSLKSYGISGRARLFEVVQRVGEINAARRRRAPGGTFTGKSYSDPELKKNSALELDYIVAKPQMSHYIEMSTKIYDIYMKYVAPEDVHVYSIDEVFIDLTAYLKTYGLTARELTQRIILDVLRSTGITATAGIGTNLYLSKIAMDIVAKHIEPDADGVHIAELTEQSYREQLWEHRPLTDFWRVGRGYAKKLEAHGMYTMGDVALRAEYDEDALYKLFGVNAGLLIDHAWGYEPCTIADIKAYRPGSSSLGSGQVLQCPYTFDKARIIVREMTEQLVLELVEKRLVTDQIILDVGYDIESLSRREVAAQYKGEVVRDHYGRQVPKPAHGSCPLGRQTDSLKLIMDAVLPLYDRIADSRLLVRRINIAANNVVPESMARPAEEATQLDLFSDCETQAKRADEERAQLEREKRRQRAVVLIKGKYGKNAILKGTNFLDGATMRDRNRQIGGHLA